MVKYVMKKINENYEKILIKSGTDFIRLKETEVCCGSPVLNAGYEVDFKTLVEKNFEIFKKHGVKKIITPCPACYKTFKKDYKKILGSKWDIEIEHTTQTILKMIKSGKLRLKKTSGKVTYHDPCHLGRHSGIYEEPREILKFLGCEVIEMKFNREQALCCGSGGGVKSNYPELASAIMDDVIEEAKKTKSSILVTACPMCDASFIQSNKDISVKEISELVVDCLL